MTASTTTLTWLETGTGRFLDAVGRLDDADFDSPTRLPGWTRAHLVAHVHHNAQALSRLTRWAATGVEHPMYASPAQRAGEIDASAKLDPQRLRQLVTDSASALADDLSSLTDEAWTAEVVTAQGRTVPATQIPWLRAREVAVHAVDLDNGETFASFSPDFLEALLVDVVRRRTGLGEGASLAGWLTGRTDRAPLLQPWL